MIQSIAFPTDFSELGNLAFEHALGLAVTHRCRLDLLHVRDPHEDSEWGSFPHVRSVLGKWQLIPDGASPADVADTLGLTVRKIEITDTDITDGLFRFLDLHRPDLLVMATHGRAGLTRWLSGSVSVELAAKSAVATLLFGPQASPFVDAATGRLAVERIAVPVDHQPSASRGLQKVSYLLELFDAEIDAFHVGSEAPAVVGSGARELPVRLVSGDVVPVILAESGDAELLLMTTAGREGVLDAIRGSTAERVINKASCPVLLVQG